METTKNIMEQYEILKALVIKEAKQLRKFSTELELNQLSFRDLNPDSKIGCIYGQMTGDCFSERANELINKCASRVYSANKYHNDALKTCELNGPPRGERGDNYGSFKVKFYSPIEKFIYMKENKNNGNNEALISFLKGATKTLKLK